jgi:hypothetical protein
MGIREIVQQLNASYTYVGSSSCWLADEWNIIANANSQSPNWIDAVCEKGYTDRRDERKNYTKQDHGVSLFLSRFRFDRI